MCHAEQLQNFQHSRRLTSYLPRQREVNDEFRALANSPCLLFQSRLEAVGWSRRNRCGSSNSYLSGVDTMITTIHRKRPPRHLAIVRLSICPLICCLNFENQYIIAYTPETAQSSQQTQSTPMTHSPAAHLQGSLRHRTPQCRSRIISAGSKASN